MKLERRLHHFIGPDSSKSGWDQGEEGFRAATRGHVWHCQGASSVTPAEYAGGSLLDCLDMLSCDSLFSVASTGMCPLALVPPPRCHQAFWKF